MASDAHGVRHRGSRWSSDPASPALDAAETGEDAPRPRRRPAWISSRATMLLSLLFYIVSIIVTYRLASSGEDASFSLEGAVNTSAAVRTPATEKIRDVRLPLHLAPESYRLRLLPFLTPSSNFTFRGDVTITLRADAPGGNITVHVRELTVYDVSVTVTEAETRRQLTVTGHRFDKDREFHVVMLGEQVAVGRRYELYMEFEGIVNDELAGFYRSSYVTAAGDTKWLAVTHFEPTDARRAFPCLDEPALKARFQLTMGRLRHMTSVSNMPVERTKPHEHLVDYEWDIFQDSVPMSTYLVAFMVGELAFREADPGLSDTLFRVWARPDAISQGDFARSVGPRVLEYLEDYFQTDFPLPKQDMAALPDFAAGAMENWGLIIYRETALLYDPAMSSASGLQRVAEVVAHELAHQWFGNLVTPSWWTDLWLNEGFATYMQCLGTDHVKPEWRMKDQFVTRVQQAVMDTDALMTSHPISIVVQHPDEIGEIFDSISYLKGASLIRMMEHMLTSATLRAGLTNYLREKKYQAAEQDDLWAFLTAQAHKDGRLRHDVSVKDIMDTWTLQAGFPVITVTRHYGRNQAQLQQERFLLSGRNSSDVDPSLWYIPLVYTSGGSSNFGHTLPTLWMKKERKITLPDAPSDDDWLLLNVQQVGYYKVNYDLKNWRMLVMQLENNHDVIHPANRAQLIDDALDLARAGRLDYSTALSVIGYLNREQDFLPWDAAFDNLKFLRSQLGRFPAYGAFKRFVLKLIGPLYARIGFEARPEDSHLTHDTRLKLLHWACAMGLQDCVDHALDKYRKWMADPDNDSVIAVNVRSVVYCSAISEGGESEWQFAWERYQAANVAAEKKVLLTALGCTEKVWLLNRYLQWIITPGSGVRVQDGAFVFGAVASGHVGRYVAWDFVRNHWPDIVKIYGAGIFTLQRFISPLKDGYNTQLDLEELINFQRKQKDNLGTAERELSQAIEVASSNLAWMEANYDTIRDWLEQQ